MMPVEYVDRCPGYADPSYFFFSNDVPAFLYYSHIPTILLAVFFAFFIGKAGSKTPGRWFLVGAMSSFALWVTSILVTWTHNDPSIITFAWGIYGALFGLTVYFLYVFYHTFSHGVYPNFLTHLFAAVLLLPVLIFTPSTLHIYGFDLYGCGVDEFESLWFVGYYFAYGAIITFLMIVTGMVAYRHTEDVSRRKQIVLVGIGTTAFLTTLFTAGMLSSFTMLYELEKYAFLGLPIFLGYLAFVIVKYRAFDIRLLSVQALVFLLLFLNFSVLFVRNISNARYIIFATMVLTFVFGRYLINGVRNEIDQRQRIGRLAIELQNTNDQQSNLMHFITHQIKGFFTKSRNISSMILDGDFGTFDPQIEKMLRLGIENDDRGVALVQELLNATNLKRGTVQYNMVDADMREIVSEAVEMVGLSAKTKGLKYGAELPVNPVHVRCDVAFIKQALRNMVDNAVKYTPAGSVTVNLSVENGFAVVRIIDTGIGFSSEDREKLFTEGGRGSQSRKINVESTGYGLYIVKNVIEQHGGHVDATSVGLGQGSVFMATLPLVL